MKEIAIYGKGGIGKSTISANLSAAIAKNGSKVLQIGCDPKHDSTRLLLNGKKLRTVLDYIKETLPLEYRLEDIMKKGFGNVGCIEAGGPKPGVGCAGRGIITAFDMLEKFNIKSDYDLILYDVLGDVVCGGFAVPIRSEYADEIFVVTSGEYMSIYAANNILKGIKNYDFGKRRVAGIIYNSRNVRDEDRRVYDFAKAVNLPVLARIPRSDVFAEAERRNQTIIQTSEEGHNSHEIKSLKGIFAKLAEYIQNKHQLFEANPLEEDYLEELVLYGNLKEKVKLSDEEKTIGNNGRTWDSRNELPDTLEEKSQYAPGYLSKNVVHDEPLHGCAFNGAMSMSVHLRDVAILAHSPKSCLYLSYQSISSSGRRALYERGKILPYSLDPNLYSTEMDENDMVFGGVEALMKKIKDIITSKKPPKAVVVVSSCPAGIIGDDISKASELSTKEIPVIVIKADGNLSGDYLQGMLMSYFTLAKNIIDPNVKSQRNIVNVVFEKVVAKNTESNFKLIERYLNYIGVKVGCRFLCNTSYDCLKNFNRASLNLLAYKDYTGMILQDYFQENYGSKFYEKQFPVGFLETEEWLRGLAEFFDAEIQVENLIRENKGIYEKEIAALRPILKGKKLMIITYNHQLDWILQTAIDAGMKISKLCILNFSQDEGFRSDLPMSASFNVEENYDKEKREEDIEKYNPDVLLANYQSTENNVSYLSDSIPMCPDVGFFTGLETLKRWAEWFKEDSEEGWKKDGHLLSKYYAG